MSKWIIWRVTEDGKMLERMNREPAEGADERRAVEAWARSMGRHEEECEYAVTPVNSFVTVQVRRIISFSAQWMKDGKPVFTHPFPPEPEPVEALDEEPAPKKK